jgi:hypothetical protein
MTYHRAALALVVLAALTGCSPHAASDAAAAGSPAAASPLSTRLTALDAAATALGEAGDLAAARRSAETVRNLVVGPHGPGYGDGDDDGTIQGETDRGLLPGVDGSEGLVDTRHPGNGCVERDVLGGSWADPEARWTEAEQALARWTPQRNTFPSLQSHVQRAYGWSSLALASRSLDDVHEYAGHLAIHLRVARQAVEHCSG